MMPHVQGHLTRPARRQAAGIAKPPGSTRARAARISVEGALSLILACGLTTLLGVDCGSPQVAQPDPPRPPTITSCGLIGSACGGNSGAMPTSVALADFDDDGDLDIAVANFGFNTVSFLANNGTGTFTVGQDIGVGDHPASIVAGDFDNNGHVDLAVTGSSGLVGPAVFVLLNRGGAGFATPVPYGVGGVATFVDTADLNGDGLLDLFTANWPSNNISILPNVGAGVFGAAGSAAVSGGPRAIVAADLTSDGRLDLAVTSENWNSVVVFWNDDTGGFTQAFSAPVGARPYGITAGDLDLDGDADLVATNQGVTDNAGAQSRRCSTMATARSLRRTTPPQASPPRPWLSRISMATATWMWRPRITASTHPAPASRC